MKISRELAILILQYLANNPKFYFPFLIMCKEYTPEDEDFVEIEPSERKDIQDDERYKTFELWENLQNLYEDTLKLMSKWFIDFIEGEIKINKYIFLTFEWFTQDSELNEFENIQMLWIWEWTSKIEAFEDFKKNNKWLFEASFDEIFCYELKDTNFDYFYLK